MPIITPAYPSMCSTHNVMHSTKSVMTNEFRKAADIVDRIMINKAKWEELFVKHDFFRQYRCAEPTPLLSILIAYRVVES